MCLAVTRSGQMAPKSDSIRIERVVLAFLQLVSGMRGAVLDPLAVVQYFEALGLPSSREDHVLDVAGVRINEHLEKDRWGVYKLDLAGAFYRHFFGEMREDAAVVTGGARSYSEAMRIWVEEFRRQVSDRA